MRSCFPFFFFCICSLALASASDGVLISDDEHLVRLANNETLLEVYVVPHSHDDVGWIISMDDYFFTEVQYIYDTVIDSLKRNPERKFTAIEVGYIELWYRNADDGRKQDMHDLYNSGQLEFQIGGIVMNDEAAASYVSIINQVQRGHQFLKETFGAIPRFGWQIDPFGSSQGTPVLAAFDCFDGLVIARIPYEWKNQRMANQSLEFVWHGTGNLGAETDMFTHVMDTWSYCTPTGFSWGDDYDIYNPPNPNPPIWKGNVHGRAEAFVSLMKEHALYFATPNIIFPFGCDFQYQNADVMYKNMDKLIEYVNDHQEYFGIHVQYARISDFFTALHNAAHTWPTYEGDFFPYNDNAESYWSGYYTSRNKLKGMSRQCDSVLRTADVLVSLAVGYDKEIDLSESWRGIDIGRVQSAISQHHDGISGTARPQVVWDYEQRLAVGMDSTNSVAVGALASLLSPGDGDKPFLTVDPSIMNQISQGNTVPIVVTNDLAWNRTEVVHVSVPSSSVSIVDGQGFGVQAQVDYNSETGHSELFFEAHLPALGYSTFYVSPATTSAKPIASSKREVIVTHVNGERYQNGKREITNGFLTMYFDDSGVLEALYSHSLLDNVTLTQDLLQYDVSSDPLQSGGAYILKNVGTAQSLSTVAINQTVEYQTGPLVNTYRRLWNMEVTIGEGSTKIVNATETFRLYTSVLSDELVCNFVEVTYHVGPLDGNKDLVTRWSSAIQSNGRFSQDDSGFLVRERVWEAADTLEVPRNYYPMVSTAYVQDSNARMTVLSAQSEGITSTTSGQLELMLHRRTLQDDGRGLGAPLNDTDRIKVQHRLIYDDPSSSESARSVHRLYLDFPPGVFYGEEKGNDWAEYITTFTPVLNQLPYSVHLLTIQQQSNATKTLVLRLQHLLQQNSDVPTATDVTVDLSTLFNDLQITDIRELALSANQEATCREERWQWATADDDHATNISQAHTPSGVSGTTVILRPSEIKTFSCSLGPK